ncbi:MAG TPA: sigma-70 family RNA polymerase sigma factor [Tepidisphaeraceae bacterium]|nr:sigma-70 family RNA polymerase sigma factor [Tepidisphaeraceae bacterium]
MTEAAAAGFSTAEESGTETFDADRPDRSSDERLAARSRRGDRAAFEELVRRTGRLVYCRHYLDTADKHRAEDLTQETFLTAWRSIGQLDDPDQFRSWLLAIARSVSADDFRSRTRKKRGGPGGGLGARPAPLRLAETVADPAPAPEESAERREARQRVTSALNALPEEYSLPLTLRYIGGADYETIGRQLGLSNGSLRGLLSRGLAKLREKLKP